MSSKLVQMQNLYNRILYGLPSIVGFQYLASELQGLQHLPQIVFSVYQSHFWRRFMVRKKIFYNLLQKNRA